MSFGASTRLMGRPTCWKAMLVASIGIPGSRTDGSYHAERAGFPRLVRVWPSYPGAGAGRVRKPLSWRPNFLTAPDGFVRLCALRCPGNGGARQPKQSALGEMEILTSGTGDLRS